MWESLLLDWQNYIWPILVSLAQITGATAVTFHALLRKREHHTIVAWIALAWLAPIVGALAYICLGINRVRRAGAAMAVSDAWKQEVKSESRPEDGVLLLRMLEHNPSIMGLARLGRAVTERELLPGNTIQPLINGDEAFPAILEAIRNAERSVTLLTYIFDSDPAGEQFLEALREAHERGVEVRVLIDYIGSRYGKPSMVRRLRKAGVPTAAFLEPRKGGKFRYFNLRNHRKIVVVDGRVGFTGGTNIRVDHCLKMNPRTAVKCLHFRVEGPVVKHMQETFANDWAYTTEEQLSGPVWFQDASLDGDLLVRGIQDGPDKDIDKMLEIILGALSVATERVRIVTPYFLPDKEIISALTVAAMRGVHIDLVLPEKNNIRIMDWATLPVLVPLLERGCKIWFSPPPFDHTKILVVDGIWSLIGSTNWDARSLRLNFEYNIECYGESLALELEKLVDARLGEAQRVTLEDITGRSWILRVRDGLARLLSPYL